MFQMRPHSLCHPTLILFLSLGAWGLTPQPLSLHKIAPKTQNSPKSSNRAGGWRMVPHTGGCERCPIRIGTLKDRHVLSQICCFKLPSTSRCLILPFYRLFLSSTMNTVESISAKPKVQWKAGSEHQVIGSRENL
jgi:hypothetical protein